ncbi:hypothetical protein BDQ12DRAFT_661667 [Crucibulum laeve]|uniref:Uncharacterized protein n=1 Tax=Crucibulum laeve TaxID=68775 RepID=A0A5C3MM80_9AGAR|nr:hypothetical protein BDQ12DRAFT_661667 [Crucibulum laeve]
MHLSSKEALTTIVSTLGGPEINPADIEWTTDIPKGKELVDWLAAQIKLVEVDDELDDEQKRVQYQAALLYTALEAEEVAIMSHLKGSSASPPAEIEPKSLPVIPVDYMTPSRLDKQAEFMNQDTALLEREIEVLKARLQLTTLASKKMEQSITSLHSLVQKNDAEILERQERLSNLSIQADMTIASALTNADSLLESLGCKSLSAGDLDLMLEPVSNATQTLTSLSSLHTALLSQAQSQKQFLDARCMKKTTPLHIEEVKAEAAHLFRAFDKLNFDEAEETAYTEELQALCGRLEAGQEGTLEEIMGEMEGDNDGEVYNKKPDVYHEVERAWSLDQAELLDWRRDYLDDTLNTLRPTLLDPLTAFHTSLSDSASQMREAEALLGTLGEEMEEVVDDVRGAKEFQASNNMRKESDEVELELLERELKRVLKENKSLRPQGAPPLVLLTEEDILAELEMLKAQERELEAREAAWVSGLPMVLNTLTSSHAPLLSTAYLNSPLNTSPPFQHPLDVATLETTAKSTAGELSGLVSRLQKEVADTMDAGRTKRKLGAFVDRWNAEQHMGKR